MVVVGGGVTGNGVSVAEREGENKRRGEKEAVQRGCGFKRERVEVCGVHGCQGENESAFRCTHAHTDLSP